MKHAELFYEEAGGWGGGGVGRGGGDPIKGVGGGRGRLYLKPVLNWANVCSPEHTSDTSTSYDSFLN